MAVIASDEFRIPISGADKASPAFSSIEKSAASLIKTAGVAGIAVNQALELAGKAARAVNRIFNASVGAFGDYEQALVGVGKTTNISGLELETLGKRVQALSQRVPLGTNALLEIGQTAGQLGVQGSENILLFTETIAKLDAATSDFKGEAAATALTRILTVTGEGVEKVDRLASVIVRLGNNFAATEGGIARVANEVARSTAIFGTTSAEIAGISAALQQLGVRAELGGTAVGSAFREISAAIAGGGSSLDRLIELTGMTGDQLQETFAEDATQVFELFIKGLNRIADAAGPAGVTGALEDFGLKGDQILKVLPVLAQRSDVLTNALSQAGDEFERNSALNEEAEKAFNTLNSRLKTLTNTVINIATNIGGKLAPFVTKAVEAMQAFLEVLQDFDWDELLRSLKNITVAIGIMTAAVWAANVAWNALLSSLAAWATGGAVTLGVTLGGIAKTMATFAVSLARAATGMVVVAAKATAMVVALGFILASIDVLARNLGNMNALLSVVGGTFQLAFIKAGQAILSIVKKITEARIRIKSFFLELGIGSEESLNKVRKTLVDISSDIVDLKAQEVQTINDLSAATKGVDFGIAGQLTDRVKQFLGSLDKAKKDTQDIAKNVGKAASTNIKVGILFSDEQIQIIQKVFNKGTSNVASAANAILMGPLAFVEAANIILDAVQKLINIIPQLLEKIANIFKTLTKLPLEILKGFRDVFSSITGFIKDFIPNLLNGIVNLIDDALEFLVVGLPEAFEKLGERIPEVLAKLIERLPEIANKFGQALVSKATHFVRLGVLLATGLAREMPQVVDRFIELVPVMAEEFANGVVFALKQLINDIANLFGLADIFNLGDIGDKFEEIGDKISRSASQLFEVVELEAAARGLDVADRIRDAINSSGVAVARLLERLWAALRGIWEWVRDNILMPLWNALTGIWEFVRDMLTASWTNLRAIWDFVETNIVMPLTSGIMQVWNWVKTNVVDPLIGGLQAVLNFWVANIINPLIAGFSWVTNLVATVAKLFLTPSWISSLKVPTPGWLSSFVSAVNKLTSFKGFSLGGLVTAGQGQVGVGVGGVGSVSVGSSGVSVSVGGHGVSVGGGGGGGFFAAGGMVGTQINPKVLEAVSRAASVAYLQAGGQLRGSLNKGTDVIPSMLTPGEFVVNRESTRRNLGLLSFINQSRGSVAPVNRETQISVVVNAKTNLSPDQIRREVVPAIKRELKRASQEGQFVISQRGLR